MNFYRDKTVQNNDTLVFQQHFTILLMYTKFALTIINLRRGRLKF